MGPHFLLFLFMAPFLAVRVEGQVSKIIDTDKMSSCLQKCLKDVLELPRDLYYQIENLDTVCDTYEDSSSCVKDCNAADQESFNKITTYHRLNCVEFRDDLEKHSECLKVAAQDIDNECKEQCTTIDDAMKSEQTAKKADATDNNSNLKQMDAVCSSIKCSTVCSYKLLSNKCPQAKDVLLRLNLRQADESRKGIPYDEFVHLPENCLAIFDAKRMNTALNGKEDL